MQIRNVNIHGTWHCPASVAFSYFSNLYLLYVYINLKHHLTFCPFELIDKLPKMSKSTIELEIVPPDHPLQENIFLSNCCIDSISIFMEKKISHKNGLLICTNGTLN